MLFIQLISVKEQNYWHSPLVTLLQYTFITGQHYKFIKSFSIFCVPNSQLYSCALHNARALHYFILQMSSLSMALCNSLQLDEFFKLNTIIVDAERHVPFAFSFPFYAFSIHVQNHLRQTFNFFTINEVHMAVEVGGGRLPHASCLVLVTQSVLLESTCRITGFNPFSHYNATTQSNERHCAESVSHSTHSWLTKSNTTHSHDNLFHMQHS